MQAVTPAVANLVENSNLLLAVLIPLFGSLVVMTLKRHPNREGATQ